MSDGQLAALGLNPAKLGLSEDFQPPEAIAALTPDASLDPEDVVWSVSQIESRFYQGNMLLRDSDTNGMAHGLEIRVPLLDQHMLDYVYSLPGHLRLPSGRADKHLLRVAFGDMLRPDLLRQTKKGFALPIGRWMQGPLRPLCEEALANLKSLGLLRVHGIDLLWRAFQNDPESPLWSRAFTLCVLGNFIKKIGATL
jgi:asparagine synthase (glutamine-hydrolysing)